MPRSTHATPTRRSSPQELRPPSTSPSPGRAALNERSEAWCSDILSDWARYPLTRLSQAMGPIATADAAWTALRSSGADGPAVVLKDGQTWLDVDLPRDTGTAPSGADELARMCATANGWDDDVALLPESTARAGDSLTRCLDHLLSARELSASVIRVLARADLRLGDLRSREGPEADPLLVTQPQAGLLTALWEVSRVVARCPERTTLLDRGLPGLAGRLASDRSGPAHQVFQAVRSLCGRYGHLGPEPWELGSASWRDSPFDLLRVIDRLASVPDDRPPPFLDTLGGQVEASPEFTAWSGLRSTAVDAVARIVVKQRAVTRRIGRFLHEEGHLHDEAHVLYLDEGELFGPIPEDVALRAYDHNALARYLPPLDLVGPVPPVVRWIDGDGLTRLRPGESLQGTGGGGSTCGRAVVLRTPAQAAQVRPGDVVIVATGGAEWLPAVLLAGAVVLNSGTPVSPVVALCRSSGIPYVTSTEVATARVRRGDVCAVDGTAGIVARPSA